MSKSFLSVLVISLLSLTALHAHAYTVTVKEIASVPCIADCKDTPKEDQKDSEADDGDGVEGSSTSAGNPDANNPVERPAGPGGIDMGKVGVVLDRFLTIGNKVWDFVINNKPGAVYNTLKASVVPSGLTSWAQLSGWAKPISKTYRVEFKTLTGKVAGGFDYRITFIYGGNFNGKGKYIGQIAVAPSNIKLHTDRSINFHAEILEPINYGTVEDPIAGVQLLITYNSPTTLRYTMHSAEYFLYGTGEIQKMTNLR